MVDTILTDAYFALRFVYCGSSLPSFVATPLATAKVQLIFFIRGMPMRPTTVRATAFVLLLQTLLCSMAPLAAAQTATKVKVPVGTTVELVFDAPVSPLTTTIGQTVTLRVMSAVLVDGITVVAAGAMAMGEVTIAQKAGSVGKEGQVGVMVRTVSAVDGTAIPISGNKVVVGENKQTSSLVITLLCCILGLLQKGGSAEIAAGSSLRATVAAPVEVTAK